MKLFKQLELVLKSKPRRRPEPGFMSSEEAKAEFQRLEAVRKEEFNGQLEDLELKAINAQSDESRNTHLKALASFLVSSGTIDSTELISWYESQGISEDDAFDWAMERFCPSNWMRAGKEQIKDEVSVPKLRSHKRKAA